MNHHSQAAVGDNVRSSVPRFTFKWNQMAVHSEMIYSNDDGNKSKSLFILDQLLLGFAVTWGLCRYGRWVMSLLCQDYYLHISASGFISVLPKRLNVVSNQSRSSLGSPRLLYGWMVLEGIQLFPTTVRHLDLQVYAVKALTCRMA